MIEFTEYRPNPCAPTIFVNKLVGIYRVKPNIMKATYALSAPRIAGIVEAVETVSLLWDVHDMIAAHDCLDWSLKEWQRGTFEITSGGRRILAQ
jgi:hypothetical protein